MPKTKHKQRAKELGLLTEYQALQKLRAGHGLADPSKLLELPAGLQEALGLTGSPTSGDLQTAIDTLRCVAAEASNEDLSVALLTLNLRPLPSELKRCPRLQYATFDKVWTDRCRDTAVSEALLWHNEGTIRHHSDRIILTILLRVLGLHEERSDGNGLESRDSLIETSKAVLRDCLKWARQAQNLDGGLPSDSIGSSSATWTTAGLLWAIAVAGAGEAMWSRRALKWLGQNFNDTDGGVPICEVGDHSVVDATAQTLLAFSLMGQATSGPAVRAAEWLLCTKAPGLGWPWRPGIGVPLTASTSLAVRALVIARDEGLELEGLDSALEEGVKWLLETQSEPGMWGRCDGEPARGTSTAYALLALDSLNIDFGDRDEACRKLLGSRTQGGKWPDVIDRPGGHTVIRWADAHCTQALCQISGSSLADECDSAIRRLSHYVDGGHFVYLDSSMHSWPTRDGMLALSAYLARESAQ